MPNGFTVPAIIGGATLLADGIIRTSVSVASAVEGLRMIKPDIETVPLYSQLSLFVHVSNCLGTKW